MGIRKYKPTTPGRRFSSVNDYAEITGKKPEKKLITPLRKTGGRGVGGRITVRHRGGGNRRKYRIIDFKRDKFDIPARVAEIQYDPNRTAFIALLNYFDGEKRYIIAPHGIQVGQVVCSGEKVEPVVGNCMPLWNIPSGMEIHNIQLRPEANSTFVRAAGASAKITAKEGNYVNVLLPSREIRRIHKTCLATIGQVSNIDNSGVVIGKAGRMRHKGRRPTVRGTAQAPVDHPMGGGEGRRAGGRHPCSPTGKLAKAGKTRKPSASSEKYIVRRRK